MFKKVLIKSLNLLGYNLIKHGSDQLHGVVNSEYEEFIDIYKACQEYSMTSIERMYALFKAVEYITRNNIKGDIVECGVWRGGSSMLIAMALQKFNCTDKIIYLYDTFEGMSKPTEKDIDASGFYAKDLLLA